METSRIKMASKATKKGCDNCGKEFTSKQSLSRHKRNCGRSTLSSCTRCQKQFARIDSLKRHAISCNKDKPKEFSCETCNKIFRNNWFLRRHLPCRGNLICPKCKRGFRKLKRYQLHRHECRGGEQWRNENGHTSNGDEEKLSFLETAVEGHILNPDIFPSDPTPTHVNDTLENNKDVYMFNHTIGEPSTLSGFHNEMDETKVYILDERLSFTEGEDSPIHADNPIVLKNVKESVEIDSLYTGIGTETTKTRNCRLAERLCGDIKTVFKEENISDVLAQLDIVTLTLQNLGLYTHVTVDLTNST